MQKIIIFSLYIASLISLAVGIILLRDVNLAVANPADYRFGDLSMLATYGSAYESLPNYVNATINTATLFFLCSTLLACFGSIMLGVAKDK